ncbi:hypothetical protein CBER1_06622 [Cercospora berteroae]|uniref:Folic acid synthesis protein FOL1 n=1 Tax=Cercospora berteroae TaxID=357750 RepID=A0A2S6C4A9_9PEZI|nr:hypothetical protein CBER1_06622 [Cercospora berteroae]
MWSRSLLKTLPKLCRAWGSVTPRYFAHCARSLNEIGSLRLAEDHPHHLSSLDDAHSRTFGLSNDNSHPLKDSNALRGVSSTGPDSSEASSGDGQTPDSPQSRDLRPDVQYDETGFQATGDDDSAYTTFRPCGVSRAVTGVERYKLSIHLPDGGQLRGPTSHAHRVQVARMLDYQIQQSHTSGLGALAMAVRAVGDTLPSDQRLALFVREVVLFPANPAVHFTMHFRRSDPLLQGTSLDGSLWVRVFANYNDMGMAALGGQSIPIKVDLTYLEETTEMVIQRIRDAMSFDGRENFAQTIAQSLLRILRFRTPHLDIERIKLVAYSSDRKKPSLHVHARWKDTESGVPAECDRLSHPVELDVKEYPTDQMADKRENDQTQEEHSKFINKITEPRSSNPEPKQEEIAPDARPLQLASAPPDGSKEVQFVSAKIQTESLRRFGMSHYRVSLRWPSVPDLPRDRLTKDLVVRATELAIKEAPGKDLLALSHAVQTLLGSIPYCSSAVLQVSDVAHASQRGAKGQPRHSTFALRTTPWQKWQRLWDFSMLAVPFSTTRIADTASYQTGEMDVKFSFSGHPPASSTGRECLEEQRDSMTVAVMEHLKPVLEEGAQISWRELADECAAALSGAQLPLKRLSSVDYVSIELSRSAKHGSGRRMPLGAGNSSPYKRSAMIALGSNVGDRIENIEAACRHLDADPDIKIDATSALYETKAMYVEEQAAFLNGMCKIHTHLPPLELLDRLQSIENELGRVKLIDKGPRNIDLDIATYGHDRLNSERLSIPHKLMLEREFVLRPFCDILAFYSHPETKRPIHQHLKELTNGESKMYALTPLAPECEPLRAREPTRRTLVMSILNVTPDSFSDGGSHEPTDLDSLRRTVNAHISAGATIIDIGGQSSRPNAPDVSPEEEISRTLPAIEVIKSMPEARHIAISVDTYRAAVAEAAIHAGAHIINDISAGLLDDKMLSTIARLGCTYVMMHMRGTPSTMQDAENTLYREGLIPMIASDLYKRLKAAEQAGIRRWRIILDPGLGFAKTAEQNAELLGRFWELRNDPRLRNFPWLVGSSRKGFIGKFTGAEDPKDRLEGTAATVTAAIAGGAEIVRVHDVEEMSRVVKMADAMYRRAPSEPKDGREAEDDGQEELENEARDEETEDDEETETETKAEDEVQK